MARGSDLPVRTKRLLNKVGGWRRTEDGEKGAKRKDGQSRQNVREDPPPAFNPHPENKKKKKRKKEDAVRLKRRCIRHEIQFSRWSQGRT